MERMKVSKAVRAKIEEIQPGQIFGLKDFPQIENSQAVILELSRLSKKGIIKRLTKGKYYVPKASRFGVLGPDEWMVLDQVLKANGGYIAGSTALNRLGVTSQVPAQVTIRGARSTRKLKIGNLTVNLIGRGNLDADYLQSTLTDVLEAIRLIKKTPDGDLEMTLRKVSQSIKSMDADNVDQLAKLAKNERPYVRALLGALMEQNGMFRYQELKSGLNPLTKYKIGIDKKLLSNKESWGIV